MSKGIYHQLKENESSSLTDEQANRLIDQYLSYQDKLISQAKSAKKNISDLYVEQNSKWLVFKFEGESGIKIVTGVKGFIKYLELQPNFLSRDNLFNKIFFNGEELSKVGRENFWKQTKELENG